MPCTSSALETAACQPQQPRARKHALRQPSLLLDASEPRPQSAEPKAELLPSTNSVRSIGPTARCSNHQEAARTSAAVSMAAICEGSVSFRRMRFWKCSSRRELAHRKLLRLPPIPSTLDASEHDGSPFFLSMACSDSSMHRCRHFDHSRLSLASSSVEVVPRSLDSWDNRHTERSEAIERCSALPLLRPLSQIWPGRACGTKRASFHER